MSKLIVNCETGEETLRELNKSEKDQQKIDEANAISKQAEIDLKIAAKQSILDRLGLTADELKTILG